MGRTIVVGDIHGCYDELVELLQKVDLASDDRVVSVGDLIVKGPKNKDVLDLFSNDARFSSVIGNHDLKVLSFWKGEEVFLKESQKQVCLELGSEKSRYAAYLNSLPFILNLNSHAVVHAGVRPGVPLSNQSPQDLVELRTLGKDRTSRDGIPWYEVYDEGPTILFGHWPFPVPRISRRAIGLDTGCVYGHQLTAHVLETGEFIRVQARKIYDPPGPGFKRDLANSLNLK
jgi:serine/threonine protein phosphatase 1